jgi:hypothetical protein
MNKVHRLRHYKIRAALLLKDFRSPSSEAQLKAAEQLRQLMPFRHCTISEILLQQSAVKLKHTQEIIARQSGYRSWADLKHNIVLEDCLYKKSSAAFLNAWYKDYNTARQHLSNTGGYLLRYRQYYFVSEDDYIENLGLLHLKDEWEKIGYDWVRPRDTAAWQTLFAAAAANYLQETK